MLCKLETHAGSISRPTTVDPPPSEALLFSISNIYCSFLFYRTGCILFSLKGQASLVLISSFRSLLDPLAPQPLPLVAAERIIHDGRP